MSIIETRLLSALTRRADRPAFALFVAAVATAATLSIAVPFGPLLVAAVLMSPQRWRSIAFCSSLGAAAGAALLYLAFHHLGWARLFEAYPEVVRSKAWQDATSWLTEYGITSLLLIAALPIPLTPALMFAAISRLPAAEVLLALWLGKLLKYLVYSWLASAFPAGVIRRRHARLDALRAALARASAEAHQHEPSAQVASAQRPGGTY